MCERSPGVLEKSVPNRRPMPPPSTPDTTLFTMQFSRGAISSRCIGPCSPGGFSVAGGGSIDVLFLLPAPTLCTQHLSEKRRIICFTFFLSRVLSFRRLFPYSFYYSQSQNIVKSRVSFYSQWFRFLCFCCFVVLFLSVLVLFALRLFLSTKKECGAGFESTLRLLSLRLLDVSPTCLTKTCLIASREESPLSLLTLPETGSDRGMPRILPGCFRART